MSKYRLRARVFAANSSADCSAKFAETNTSQRPSRFEVRPDLVHSKEHIGFIISPEPARAKTFG
jgi:hypothetical protein